MIEFHQQLIRECERAAQDRKQLHRAILMSEAWLVDLDARLLKTIQDHEAVCELVDRLRAVAHLAVRMCAKSTAAQDEAIAMIDKVADELYNAPDQRDDQRHSE